MYVVEYIRIQKLNLHLYNLRITRTAARISYRFQKIYTRKEVQEINELSIKRNML